jgi:hypothetical protein
MRASYTFHVTSIKDIGTLEASFLAQEIENLALKIANITDSGGIKFLDNVELNGHSLLEMLDQQKH